MTYRVRIHQPDRDIGTVFGRTIDEALQRARILFKRHDVEVYTYASS